MKNLSYLFLAYELFLICCLFSFSPTSAMGPGEIGKDQKQHAIVKHSSPTQLQLPGNVNSTPPAARSPAYNLALPPPLVLGSSPSGLSRGSPSSVQLPNLRALVDLGVVSHASSNTPTTRKIQVSTCRCCCCYVWCCGCVCEDNEPERATQTPSIAGGNMSRQAEQAPVPLNTPVTPTN